MIVAKEKAGNLTKVTAVIKIADLLTKDAEDMAFELFVQKAGAAFANASPAVKDPAEAAFESWEDALSGVCDKIKEYLWVCVTEKLDELGEDAFDKRVMEFICGEKPADDAAGSN